MSVADALAPYDAASHVHQRRLAILMQNFGNALTDDCIEARGVPRIGLEIPPRPYELLIDSTPSDFPNMEGLEQNGFRLPPELGSEEYDDGHVILTEDQQEAMDECIEDDSVARAELAFASYEPIITEWSDIMEEVDQLPEVVTLRSDFSVCALDAGIGPDFAADEFVYLGTIDDAITRYYGREDRSSPPPDPETLKDELRDLGQIYYQCGVDLFERKIELRLERRDEFLDQHWDAVVELSELLYGEGLIAEPEADR